jgi:hypothetical protein
MEVPGGGIPVAESSSMTTLLPILLFVAASASTPQSATVPPESQPTPVPKTLTLTGCVQVDPAKSDVYTLSDKSTGSVYRLTGSSVKAYVWKNVRIVGGLAPSANLAAQAGAIDATQTARAYESGSRPGPQPPIVLELNVLRVRPTTGSCAPAAK